MKSVWEVIKNVHIIVVLITLTCAICGGCRMPDGAYEGAEALRVNELEVDSFSQKRAITAGWRGNAWTDEYILMRARDEIDGVGPYEQIYRGQGMRYTDRDVQDDIRYVYRIDVVQGGKVHEGEYTGIGVGNNAEMDLNEPNNRKEEATAFNSFKRGTMYYFRFSDRRELSDVDWYKVRVSGGGVAYLQIREDGVAGMTTLQMRFEGQEAFLVEQGKWYELRNEARSERELYIEIRADEGSYVETGFTGGTIRGYTIVRSDSMEDEGNEPEPPPENNGNNEPEPPSGNNGNNEPEPPSGNNGNNEPEPPSGNNGSNEPEPPSGNNGNNEPEPPSGNNGNNEPEPPSGNNGNNEPEPPPGNNGNNEPEPPPGNNGNNEPEPPPGNNNGGTEGEKTDPEGPTKPGENIIEEKSELFEADGTGRLVFFLNEKQYQGRSYTFWKYLEKEWKAVEGMEMELAKESGNYLGGYGYFFAGGHVEGYGESMLVLLIQKDGNYTIGKVIEGKYEELVAWRSSVYLRKGYGVKNTAGVRWDNERKEYVVTMNGVEQARFVDTREPVCTGVRTGIVAVVTGMEQFPQTPVKVGYR